MHCKATHHATEKQRSSLTGTTRIDLSDSGIKTFRKCSPFQTMEKKLEIGKKR